MDVSIFNDQIAQRSAAVDNALRAKNNKDAVVLSLQDPPFPPPFPSKSADEANDGPKKQYDDQVQSVKVLPSSRLPRPLFTRCASQDTNYQVVLKALTACRDDELKLIIQDLPEDLCDNLMKFLYKGLGLADSSGQLLKAHMHLTEKAGLGCIMRAMTDRKAV
jgi:actin related protein 2/3 complex subunit 5